MDFRYFYITINTTFENTCIKITSLNSDFFFFISVRATFGEHSTKFSSLIDQKKNVYRHFTTKLQKKFRKMTSKKYFKACLNVIDPNTPSTQNHVRQQQ